MVERSPSVLLVTVLTVVAIVVAGVGAGVLYELTHPPPASGPATVAIGDNVTVNYIGIFGSGPQIGRVFDTSIKAIAVNNASWPKSLQYTPRSAGRYTPLPVYVGPNAPSGGYTIGNLTYGGVVTGFWQGLVGLQVNQTRYVTVPADLGYGPTNTSCLKNNTIQYTIPTVVTLTPDEFNTTYKGASAEAGVEFPDPLYNWTDVVVSSNASAVVVENLASLGWTVSPFGWAITVTNLTSSTITLTNEMTAPQAGLLKGTSVGLTICGTSDFIVSAIDLEGGTYTANYNKEVVGQTLVFIVTVVNIQP